jgi:hypothetical protein
MLHKTSDLREFFGMVYYRKWTIFLDTIHLIQDAFVNTVNTIIIAMDDDIHGLIPPLE